MVRLTGQLYLDKDSSPKVLSLTQAGVVADMAGFCIYGQAVDMLRFARELETGIVSAMKERGPVGQGKV